MKVGYGCEPCIHQATRRHLRHTIAHFWTGSRWLNIETGRHRKLERTDAPCAATGLSTPGLAPEKFDSFTSDDERGDPVEDEHHAIFGCSGYDYACELLANFF